MILVSFLREKSKALEKFKEFKVLEENEIDFKIKTIRSNNGGEFTSKEFDEFCKKKYIKRNVHNSRGPMMEWCSRKRKQICSIVRQSHHG